MNPVCCVSVTFVVHSANFCVYGCVGVYTVEPLSNVDTNGNGTEVVSEVSSFEMHGRVVLEGLLFGEVSSFQEYSCLEVFPLLEASSETLETLVGLSVCGCVTESSYSSWYVCS